MNFLREPILAVVALSLTALLFVPFVWTSNQLWQGDWPFALKLVLELLLLSFAQIALLPVHLYLEDRRDEGRPISKPVTDLFRSARWPWPVLAATILGPTCGVVGWAFREHANAWIGGVGVLLFILGWLTPILALFLWRDTRPSSARPRPRTSE